MVRFIPLLAVLALWLPAAPASPQNVQSDVAKAQKTLDDMNKLIDGIGKGRGTATAAAPAAAAQAADRPAAGGNRQGRVVTVLLKGSI